MNYDIQNLTIGKIYKCIRKLGNSEHCLCWINESIDPIDSSIFLFLGYQQPSLDLGYPTLKGLINGKKVLFAKNCSLTCFYFEELN